jgi:3-hydroxyacyl-CoA dehydrogenase
MPVVSSSRDQGIALILIDNPPVNATSAAVRAELLAAMKTALADDAVLGIVIACEGSTFVAGADIKEFGQPPVEPHLSTVTDFIEDSAKPVVAAIHGTALGGGLELALGCHYRVARADAKVGLPEVTLGIIPGAGGIQRLARLAEAAAVLDIVVHGKPLAAGKAAALGLIDEVVAHDVRDAALAMARSRALTGAAVRRVRELPVKPAQPALFAEMRRALAKSHRGQPAPLACVDILEAAQHQGFAETLALGRQRFRELVQTPQAEALRHAFFSERVATRNAELPRETLPIERVGVIGAGTMGTGIAMCFLNAGIAVVLLEQDEKVLQKSVQTIHKTYQNDLAKKRLDAEAVQAKLALLQTTLAFEALRECDLIVEAVFEDMAIKKEVFKKMDAVAKPGAILASNTSYLNIEELADATSRPESVVGMHFFSPAHLMRLLENVRARQTSPLVLSTVQALGKRLNKVAVLVGVSDGFVGNRMLSKRTRESYFLLEEGALPKEVDEVLYGFGLPMGPFQMTDLAGLDVAWRNRQGRLAALSQRERDCNILDEMVASGRLGQKTSSGFYRYDPDRQRSVDTDVETLIVDNATARGITRRRIDKQEILERCLFSMINEGAKILEEGVVSRPEDIDTIWMNGYGFPRYRGGPMFYADQLGLKQVYERVLHYRDTVGAAFWEPAPLLARLAEAGGSFYQK